MSKSSASQCAFRMSRTCHGCHAPLDDDHKDYPSGWQKCPLDHWTGCEGGIVQGKAANGSEWRACPPDYVFVEGVSTDDEEPDANLSKKDMTVDENTGEVAVSAASGAITQDKLETNLEFAGSGDENADGDSIVRQLEEANKLLKQQVAARAREEDAACARKVAMLKADNIRLSQAMGGDIGGVKVKTVSGSHPHPKNQKTKKVVPKTAQGHLSRSTLRTSEYRPEDDSIYTGLDIRGIRKLPELQSQVERLVSQVQDRAPSLDRRPSFVPVRATPPGAAFGDQQHHTAPQSHRSGGVQDEDVDTSSDEDCGEVPQSGHIFKWKRDENGEKYFIEVVQMKQKEELVYRYVKDNITGRSYKRLVLKNDPEKELISQWVIDPDTGRKVKMLVPCQLGSGKQRISKQSSSQPVRFASSPGFREAQSDGFSTPLLPSAQRKSLQQSFSSIPPRNLSVLQDEKQGKMPSIVQFARNCPVSWTGGVHTFL